MRLMLGTIVTGVLLIQAAFPTVVAAQPRTDGTRFVLPARAALAAAAQAAPARKSSRPGGVFIRNMAIGAAVGAGLMLSMGTMGDCGDCGAERTKMVFAGAMYGAMIGAAIRIHPSRRPSITAGPHIQARAR